MLSACLLVLSVLAFIGVVSSTDDCNALVRNSSNLRLVKNECDILSDSKAKCSIYLVSRNPRKEESSADSLEVVYLDYAFHFILQNSSNAAKKCLLLDQITFARRMDEGNRERKDVPIPSRLYYILGNAHELATDIKIPEKKLVGLLDCTKNSGNDDSECRYLLQKSSNVEDSLLNLEGMSLSFTSLNYSFPKEQFPDHTRQGRRILESISGDNITSFQMRNVEWKTLDAATLPKNITCLTHLEISGTKIKEFEPDFLANLCGVQYLSLARNELRAIPEFAAKQSNVIEFDFSGNANPPIANITAAMVNMTKLVKLNLGQASIKYFQKSTLHKLPDLTYLNLTGCDILTIDGGSFDGFPNLRVLDLSTNEISKLPSGIFENLLHLQYLDMSYNYFLTGPNIIINSKLEVLDLSFNRLNQAEDLVHSSSRGTVKYLNLTSNNLGELKLKGINLYDSSYKPRFEYLNLSVNRIPSFSYDVGLQLKSLQEVDLTGNLFNCDDCELRGFQRWLNETKNLRMNGKMADGRNLNCIQPQNKTDTKIVHAELIDDCKGPNLLLVIGLPVMAVIGITSVIGGTLYSYRFEISYIMHLLRIKKESRKQGKPIEECLYDCFVSYSGKDRNFVLRILQPTLEESEEKYRICLHERDFRLGAIISQNIVQAIDKSRSTLIILSKNFVESQWCRWEMEMANHRIFTDKRDFLILIELERLNRRDLPRHLKFLMDTRTYLEWPGFDEDQRDFWRRLGEALGRSLYTQSQQKENEERLRKLESGLPLMEMTQRPHVD